MSGFVRRAVVVMVVLVAGFAGTACGDSEGSKQQTAAQPTVHDLYREFLVRLKDRNAPGVCALFTEDGLATFKEVWDSTNCEGAVDRAVAEFGSLDGMISRAGSREINEKDGIAKFGSDTCNPGRFYAKHTDAGWLFFEYKFLPNGSCGG